MTSSSLVLGGLTLDRAAARRDAEQYLAGHGGYSYPAYHAFEAGAGPWKLSDGDFLAPALLNVSVRVPAFYSLAAVRGSLEAWLGKIPSDARLVDAGPDELSLLGDLFAVLDDGLPGVGGTTLAKIMHRKRPAFVPLYDRYIWWCYVGMDGAPVPRDRHRKWGVFIQQLGEAMVNDLRREGPWLAEVASLATGPVPITTLLSGLPGDDVQRPKQLRPIDHEASSDDTTGQVTEAEAAPA